jgi:gamma-glutamyl hercynylcysteine S-oxide synthase
MDLIKVQSLPLKLDKVNIYSKLQDYNLNYKPNYLKQILNELSQKLLFALQPIIDKKCSGKQYTDYKHSQSINTVVWQFGHLIVFFLNNTIRLLLNQKLMIECKTYINKIIKYLSLDINISNGEIDYYDYYDSFITSSHIRYKLIHKVDINNLVKAYKLIIELLNIYLDNEINNRQYLSKEGCLNPVDSYLIMIGILHNDMHYEAILFTQKFYSYPNPTYFKTIFLDVSNSTDSSEIDININININIENDIEFISIKGEEFTQGYSTENKKEIDFSFDNERPAFKTHVDDFTVSKYPITEGQYIEFIDADCYNDFEYWCLESWEWLSKYEILLPLGWSYDFSNGNTETKMEKQYYKKVNNRNISVNRNSKKPICHISWYEANAYCNWKGVRLMKESEWEYLATQKGTTRFPWGNQLPDINNVNIDYTNGDIIDVDYFDKRNNENKNEKNNNLQLIGNVWEWCDEVIYPYNGFEIDPVYREMSYPFFGRKRICRGGCWATSNFLISGTYRNAQDPDCRLQWIGFRVCQK